MVSFIFSINKITRQLLRKTIRTLSRQGVSRIIKNFKNHYRQISRENQGKIFFSHRRVGESFIHVQLFKVTFTIRIVVFLTLFLLLFISYLVYPLVYLRNLRNLPSFCSTNHVHIFLSSRCQYLKMVIIPIVVIQFNALQFFYRYISGHFLKVHYV